ncbi:leucine-rich repeat-containing protein 41 isoform X2 [Protopterus annectens]|uniref:leucine-rich repeat-containing protein 41 isoform X2 n=1 Tax=Protopterus annectens TaxID=7888 RepID=UPI001CFAFEFB|nr:leucine-rich repeat-containing protein 41 isoform X2 [Protopterus annectens]
MYTNVSDVEEPFTLYKLCARIVGINMQIFEKDVCGLPAGILSDVLPHLNIYYLERIEEVAAKKGLSTQPVWYRIWKDVINSKHPRFEAVKCWKQKFLESFFYATLLGSLELLKDYRLNDSNFCPLVLCSRHITQLNVQNKLQGELIASKNQHVLEILSRTVETLKFSNLRSLDNVEQESLIYLLHRLIHHGAVKKVSLFSWPLPRSDLLAIIMQMSAGHMPFFNNKSSNHECSLCTNGQDSSTESLRDADCSARNTKNIFHLEDSKNGYSTDSCSVNASEVEGPVLLTSGLSDCNLSSSKLGNKHLRDSSSKLLFESHSFTDKEYWDNSRLGYLDTNLPTAEPPAHVQNSTVDPEIPSEPNCNLPKVVSSCSTDCSITSDLLKLSSNNEESDIFPENAQLHNACKGSPKHQQIDCQNSFSTRSESSNTDAEDLFDFVFAISSKERVEKTKHSLGNSIDWPIWSKFATSCRSEAAASGISYPVLGARPCWRSMTVLEIHSVRLSSYSCQVLRNLLSSWISLEKLILTYNDLNSNIFCIYHGLLALSECTDNRLTTISIKDTFLNMPMMELLHSFLSAFPRLRVLCFSLCMDASPNPEEEEPKLDSTGFSDSLLSLKKLSIHDVNLVVCQTEVIYFLQHSSVEDVKLSYCRLFERNAEQFLAEFVSTVKRSTTIKGLRLPGNRLGNQGLLSLSGIFSRDSLPCICSLDVSSNCIKPDGLLLFAVQLEIFLQTDEQRKLENLNICQNLLDQDSETTQKALQLLRKTCHVISDRWHSSQAFADHVSVM